MERFALLALLLTGCTETAAPDDVVRVDVYWAQVAMLEDHTCEYQMRARAQGTRGTAELLGGRALVFGSDATAQGMGGSVTLGQHIFGADTVRWTPGFWVRSTLAAGDSTDSRLYHPPGIAWDAYFALGYSVGGQVDTAYAEIHCQ